MQHFKYVPHLLKLENNSLQKQIDFSCERKKFTFNHCTKNREKANFR